MRLIYRSKGAAGEYAPLGLTVYQGCPHACSYCYVGSFAKRFNRRGPGDVPVCPPGFHERLDRELSRMRKPIKEDVLLSFMSDPYPPEEMTMLATHKTLCILLDYHVPVIILTKGGERCLRDIDVFKNFGQTISVGATLTFYDDVNSQKWETGASTPFERLETLKVLHNAGIKTWASMEPVIDPGQTLDLIAASRSFVDLYKIGKWNHDPRANRLDWQDFGIRAVNLCRRLDKKFYIKRDLAECLPAGFLSDMEKNSWPEVKP